MEETLYLVVSEPASCLWCRKVTFTGNHMIQVKAVPPQIVLNFQIKQYNHKFKNFKYILLTMYPFDKIMLQVACNALDINCTHYTKTRKPQQQQQQKIKVSKPFGDKSYLNYTQLNEIFLRKIYKYFFFLCYSYTI